MSVNLTELGAKVGLSPKELRERITQLGFDVPPRAKTIEDDLAELLEDELKQLMEKSTDIAAAYGEEVDKEMQREVVKKQRKKTAGKIDEREKSGSSGEISAPVIMPGDSIEIPDVISVKEFAEKTGLNPVKIIGELMKNGITANINQEIDFDTAQIVAVDMGLVLKKKRGEAEVQDILEGNIEALLKEDDVTELQSRPPVISIMGHVDHGKTSLLDYIRQAAVQKTEHGGITQHIGAYQVEKNDRMITFLDTPGHEAFTAMRARGAKATDIAILVVAAEEGPKPQTLEAIDHAREADIPIIVAITKIDKEAANIDRVKAALAEHELQPEEWGGKTIMVPVSSVTGEGIPKLLEMILLVADMEELKANPNRPAVATVIEAHLDPSLGPIATVIINTGTLRIMDNVVVGGTYGRIKAMHDYLGKRIQEAPPSTPVRIAGLSETPETGDLMQVFQTERAARDKAQQIKTVRKMNKQRALSARDEIAAKIHQGEIKILKIILKADTEGSLEAIRKTLGKLESENVAWQIIHSGVGNVSESDVMMAKASNGICIGFHTLLKPQVKKLAERESVPITHFTVIYQLADEVKKILSGMLEPEEVIVELGAAEVLQIFYTGKKDMIVGCKITKGKFEKAATLRIFRPGESPIDEEGNEQPIADGKVEGLKLVDKEFKEIKEGNECGLRFTGSIRLLQGDRLEAFKKELHERTL